MQNNPKYAVLVDTGTQWFSYLVQYKDGGAIEHTELSARMESPFLSNLLDREPDLNLEMNLRGEPSNSYYGWSVSKKDYMRLKKLIELHPIYLEYLRLGEYKYP